MRTLLSPYPRRRLLTMLLVALIAANVGWAQVGTYYNAIDTSSSTFVADLHNLIYPHTKLSYSITVVADIAARDTTNGQKYVDCVYSGHRQVYSPPWTWGTFSREHTWCHSWMPTYSSESGPEYSDLHHLFPTHQNNANGRRSNHPLGIVVNVTYQYLDGKLGTNATGQVVYEPRHQQKGDAARALFYMATAYHGVNGKDWSFGYLNTVTLPALSEAPQDVELLRQWHAQDPPDDRERARNDSVFARQQNRNPFVDHPEYVNVINFLTMTKRSSGTSDVGEGAAPEVPSKLFLGEPYPNPFNPTTALEFRTTAAGPATLVVYNLVGQPIDTLFEGVMEAGRDYRAVWDAGLAPSGFYVAKLEGAGKMAVRRIMLVR